MKPKILDKKFYFFVILYLSASPFLFSQTTQLQARPQYNVLFIIYDDMNDRLSFTGWPEVKTPNMQRLLSHGMLFTHVYTQYPSCNASRTSLLSGWRPDHTNVFNNNTRPSTVISPTVKYLPTYFKNFGYNIERYGKIMHASYENDITWDHAEPPEKMESIVANAASDGYPPGTWWVLDDDDSVRADVQRTTHLINRLRQTRTKPFFYGLGFTLTHDPFSPRLKYWNKIGDATVQELLPKDTSGTTSPSFKGNGSGNIVLPSTPTNDRADVPAIAFNYMQLIKPNNEWKRTIHAYDAEVAETDAQLGLVLDELDRQKL